MKIQVITTRSVFSSDATTNRMLSLAKGLMAVGHEVQITCLTAIESTSLGEISGKVYGIPYIHLISQTSFNSNSKLIKVLLVLGGTARGIKKLKNESPPEAILLLSISPIHLFAYLWMAMILSIPVFHERNEYPHLSIRTFLDRVFLWLYLKHIVPRFAGLALMTRALMKYFEENCPRCPPTLHLPMTVDPERFLIETLPPIAGRYIAHCGTSFGDKDGVPILVEAFARISVEFPDVKLVLIGSDVDQNAMEHLQQRIQELGIQERVVLTGQIMRDEMPAWLQHAELLVLARPANLQAAGGFPTKLGEYLISARPVVVTRVGEISDYLQDGVNAWLAEPGSVENFTAKLREVLTLDSASRNTVGLRGRDTALSVFNFMVQGRRFAQFIEEQAAIYRDNRI